MCPWHWDAYEADKWAPYLIDLYSFYPKFSEGHTTVFCILAERIQESVQAINIMVNDGVTITHFMFYSLSLYPAAADICSTRPADNVLKEILPILILAQELRSPLISQARGKFA